MSYPTTRLVFDRKKTATDTKAALIQVEIMYERSRKYVTTGVKVYKDQWNNKGLIINRDDMYELNMRINEIKAHIDKFINNTIQEGEKFTLDKLERWLRNEQEQEKSFIEWVEERIASRNDIVESTKKTQMKLITALQDFSKITDFSEVTLPNIMRFDEWLSAKGIKQYTIWSYHKTLKTYVHEAFKLELIKKDPYTNFKIKKGESEWGRFVTEKELDILMNTKMPTQSLEHIKDLFIFQCYTGMAYADLTSFTKDMIRKKGKTYVLSGKRIKTKIQYTVVLLPQAMEILKKYDYKLPKITNQQYNMRLKVMADACGIDKPLASHYARRTCGMLLLNAGIPIEVVAKVLGHSNIKITQEAYAQILDDTVINAFKKMK